MEIIWSEKETTSNYIYITIRVRFQARARSHKHRHTDAEYSLLRARCLSGCLAKLGKFLILRIDNLNLNGVSLKSSSYLVYCSGSPCIPCCLRKNNKSNNEKIRCKCVIAVAAVPRVAGAGRGIELVSAVNVAEKYLYIVSDLFWYKP